MGYLANALGDANNLGFFATPAALAAAYPVGAPGYFAIVGSTNTLWVWDEGTSAWVDSGTAGTDAYVYIAYASDAIGTNFSNTFNPSLSYIAIKNTTVQIPSPVVGDFVGLWTKYLGTDGDDAYVYIAYASDSIGTGFTLTFNAALDYIAIKNTTVAIPSPVVGDFTGLWKKYKGETGPVGPAGPGSGDVNGPAANTDNFIPQWNGNNTKTLKNGLAVPAGGLAGLDLVNTKQQQLTCVSKTANYTAQPFELVNCDLSVSSLDITLPSAPADKTIIWVKVNVPYQDRYVTLKTSGADKFNTPTGTVAIYMYLFGEYAQLQYCATSGLWTTFISAGTFNFAGQFPGIDQTTPISASEISINYTTRVLTINPTLGYFNAFTDGGGVINRWRKSGVTTFPAFTDTSGVWYFYIDNTGAPIVTQTPWTDFSLIAPIYRVIWNKTLYSFTVTSANATAGATYTNNGKTYTVLDTIASGTTLKMSCTTGNPLASGTLTKATGTGDATITFSAFSEADKSAGEDFECHLNTIPAIEHARQHRGGSIWYSGQDLFSNKIATGNPNVSGLNTCIGLSGGTNFDDNLPWTLTNGTGTGLWEQDLGTNTPALITTLTGAKIPVRIQDAGGLVRNLPITRFPFAFSANNVIEYISSTGVRTEVPDKDFCVYYLYSFPDPRNGLTIKAVSDGAFYTSLTLAQASSWETVKSLLPSLADSEIRPLYKCTYESRAGYDVAVKKAVLRETIDIRTATSVSSTIASGSIPASSVTVVASGSLGTNAQTSLENLDSGKQASLGFTPENLANKTTSIPTDGTSDIKYPSAKAVKDYADSLVTGLLDYRGAYNASVNTFPASGGSGTAGAVLKGDMWIISVAGTLGGTAVQIGDSIIANVDTPGQTAGNWNTLNGNISYVPEDVANKVTSLSGASTDTQYPSAKVTFDQLALKAPLRPVTAKTILVDADEITGNDSANTFSQIRTTWTNVKSFLKTYFDGLYATIASVPVKATGAELDTGTDDAKFATAKAIKDSHNIPSVAPSTSGNIMTSNGTDWTSSAPIGGGTYNFTAAENITIGQTVGIVNNQNKVARAYRSGVTVAHGISGNNMINTQNLIACAIGGDKFVRLDYTTATNDTLFAQVGTVDKNTNTVTVGTAVAVATAITPTSLNLSAICKLGTDKFIVFFLEDASATVIKYRIGTVSGNTITFGSIGTAITAGSTVTTALGWCACYLADDKGAFCFKAATSTNSKVTVFTVSGTTATFSVTPVTPSANLQTSTHSYMTKIGTDKFTLMATINGGSCYGQVFTCSGTVITAGTEAVICSTATNSGFALQMVSPATDVLVVKYPSGATTICAAATVSGTTISAGAALDLNSSVAHGQNGGIYAVSSSVLYVTGGNSDITRLLYKVTLSGNTLTNAGVVSLPFASLTPQQTIYIDNGYGFCIQTDATNYNFWIENMSNSYLGIAQETSTAGNTVSVLTKGKDSNQSNLVIGGKYKALNGSLSFISSQLITGGAADTIATLPVGTAISATEIII